MPDADTRWAAGTRLRSEVLKKADEAEPAGSSAGPLKHIWVLSAATGQAPPRSVVGSFFGH